MLPGQTGDGRGAGRVRRDVGGRPAATPAAPPPRRRARELRRAELLILRPTACGLRTRPPRPRADQGVPRAGRPPSPRPARILGEAARRRRPAPLRLESPGLPSRPACVWSRLNFAVSL